MIGVAATAVLLIGGMAIGAFASGNAAVTRREYQSFSLKKDALDAAVVDSAADNANEHRA